MVPSDPVVIWSSALTTAVSRTGKERNLAGEDEGNRFFYLARGVTFGTAEMAANIEIAMPSSIMPCCTTRASSKLI